MFELRGIIEFFSSLLLGSVPNNHVNGKILTPRARTESTERNIRLFHEESFILFNSER